MNEQPFSTRRQFVKIVGAEAPDAQADLMVGAAAEALVKLRAGTGEAQLFEPGERSLEGRWNRTGDGHAGTILGRAPDVQAMDSDVEGPYTLAETHISRPGGERRCP